jgi:hypothetical protein
MALGRPFVPEDGHVRVSLKSLPRPFVLFAFAPGLL